MERTKLKDDGKIKWKKTGGGSFRLGNGKIIKSGQVFKASQDEIPQGVRDVVIPLDKVPEEVAETLEAVKSNYSIQKRGASTWYDVVDGQGKKLNDKALRRSDALQLIKDLE